IRLLSQMSEGHLQASDERNDLMATWQANWKGDFEIEGKYQRYFNRRLSAFGGFEGSEEDLVGIVGLHLLLPFLIEGEIRIDSQADLQVSLERRLAILPRLIAFGRVE
ncbi:MAG: hypothetical protein KDK66_01220, partial [Deltaproteobacteria bacterium]|nr:hypothetical protein [Deltaproteobacteria bacterium]